jgi:hypothetical protein
VITNVFSAASHEGPFQHHCKSPQIHSLHLLSSSPLKTFPCTHRALHHFSLSSPSFRLHTLCQSHHSPRSLLPLCACAPLSPLPPSR